MANKASIPLTNWINLIMALMHNGKKVLMAQLVFYGDHVELVDYRTEDGTIINQARHDYCSEFPHLDHGRYYFSEFEGQVFYPAKKGTCFGMLFRPIDSNEHHKLELDDIYYDNNGTAYTNLFTHFEVDPL